MNGPFIVALDQGTSGCRAVAVDKNGQVCAQHRQTFSPQRLQPGLSEYDATQLLEAQLGVLNGLLDEIGPQQVAALAVCSQRSSVVLWQADTGQPLAPVLTWEDGRARQEAEEVSLSQAEVHTQTGLFKTPYFSAPKIAWCLTHYPAVQMAARAGTLRVAPVASYVVWHLTNGTTFATDATLAQRTLLWDIRSGQWSEDLCRAFSIPRTCLPEVFATRAHYGSYRYKGAQIPIYVCVADQQAAALYEQVGTENTLVNYGTGAFVLQATGPQLVVLPGMLSSVCPTAQSQAFSFLLEGPVFAAGSVLDWLKANGFLNQTCEANQLAARARCPVRFVPSFGGLGAPYWNYTLTKPIWENVSAQTTAADWIAGALQGIAHLVADIVEYVDANGQPVTKLTATGGLSHIEYLLQFQADLLQRPVYVQTQRDSTVLGSAYLAAQYLGWPAGPWHATPKRVISPTLPVEQAHLERAQWRKFVRQSFHL